MKKIIFLAALVGLVVQTGHAAELLSVYKPAPTGLYFPENIPVDFPATQAAYTELRNPSMAHMQRLMQHVEGTGKNLRANYYERMAVTEKGWPLYSGSGVKYPHGNARTWIRLGVHRWAPAEKGMPSQFSRLYVAVKNEGGSGFKATFMPSYRELPWNNGSRGFLKGMLVDSIFLRKNFIWSKAEVGGFSRAFWTRGFVDRALLFATEKLVKFGKL